MRTKRMYLVLPFVIAIIRNAEGNILVGNHPNKPSKPYPGRIDFPGGKIEKGEQDDEAIYREVLEETGFKIIKFEEFGKRIFSGEDPLCRNHLPSLGICFVVTE